MSGGRLMVWLRFCNAVIGVPAAMRPITGMATTERALVLILAGSPAGSGRAAEVALDHARREFACPRAGSGGVEDSGQAQHLERAGAVGQAADEAALLKRNDQPVDAGFGAQIERVLHLVEGGRNAGFLQPLVE